MNSALYKNLPFYKEIQLCNLKGPKREKLHAMHVKELIKTNYFER